MKMHDASINEILTMDPLFQVICKMKNQDDMTLREIAETLNMTESKVKNCYYKNKEVLKETLMEKYSDLYVVYRDASHDKDEEESAFY
jgi:DNA-directed RNA polymerase specialized sigma24 family protein